MMGSDINHNDSGLHADSDGIHAAFDFRVKSEIRITSLLTSEFKLEVGKNHGWIHVHLLLGSSWQVTITVLSD